ncbi:MAG: twin-arginine translocase subunit TatC [Hyphomicrobiaceae bacterium]
MAEEPTPPQKVESKPVQPPVNVATPSGAPKGPTPEDLAEIEASKAPLLDHLIELRQRLFYAVIAIALGFIVCFAFAQPIYNILVWPYKLAAGTAQPIEMIYTAPQEFLFTQMKLALFGAIFITFPILAGQLYMFVAPGLYRHERNVFVPYLIATPLLFVLGALFVYFIIMPFAMRFFLSMQQLDGDVHIQLQARVSEYLSLIMWLILAFGVSFQLPVVLTLLGRIGIVSSSGLKTKRRWAVLGIAILAAIVTPPDPFSMLSLMIPTYLLYEASIWIVGRIERRRAAAQAG